MRYIPALARRFRPKRAEESSLVTVLQSMMPLFAVVPDDRPFPTGATNRVLTAVEYVDTDPGAGSGTAINPEDVAYDEATESIATLSISGSSIPNGSRRIGVCPILMDPVTYLGCLGGSGQILEGQPYNVPQVDHWPFLNPPWELLK